ncbi:starch phosphorylase [Desulfitispora alkaliphila]|uniref:glycogen/starch/alpha-glucan phosphorylase n=1 Tax=Desulfitispora alkaliphila TaxID=622674 RepID=UPI003D21894E
MFEDARQFKEAFVDKLQTMQGVALEQATNLDKYMALGGVIRDYIYKNWVETNNHYRKKESKQVYYFSLEFLLGRQLRSNLLNANLSVVEEALQELNIDLSKVEEMEPDAGLGNGGLGRLAACFLDSLASLQLPGHGCGIRYKYGHFEQKIVNGYQVELPDNWLKEGNVWEVRRGDKAVMVKFGGQVRLEEIDGKLVPIHENYDPVLAVPYDTPVVGFKNNTINTLRLWNAESGIKEFDFPSFNHGDYMKAVQYKYETEAISQVLYPDDSHQEGQVLRLKQEYFLVSAGVQSILRSYKKGNKSIRELPEQVVIHLNDTHPVLAIPELMRILMDEEGFGWDEAWEITQNTMSYTNHTTLAEALEKWPVDIFKELLPRIYMIVEEINKRFCRELWERYPGQWDRIAQMAIIADGFVKMAHLAIVGSYSVNGVARIHTEILKKQEMKNFYKYYPQKFNNKTNGITHRRWLLQANPKLADLITNSIGTSWIKHPEDLKELRFYAQDASFKEELQKIKRENKEQLAQLIQEQNQVQVEVDSIFDVQIKRLHAYKRQLLNALHILHLYNKLREAPQMEFVPRTFIFGAKAAPSYYHAKWVIKLINSIADKVNNDKSIQGKLKVVFLENYRVSLAEKIIPAADVSEQISTASKEASGTGNMKLMMNGAITIGTLDGANIEILEQVGSENIFTFGLTEQQVIEYYAHGGYNSWEIYHQDEQVRAILDQLVNGFLGDGSKEFKTIYNYLLHNNDEYFVLKDFASYANAQQELERAYRDQNRWREMSAINIANSGGFSSDRTISEYATGIWKVEPLEILGRSR